MGLSILKNTMVKICNICSCYDAIVECTICHEGNCAVPSVCCFTYARTENTLMIVCYECYTEIENNLIPIREKKRRSKKKSPVCRYAHYSPVVMI